jgi:hypothetical protein
MGHAEMLLAVAGLEKTALQERVDTLASGDWSYFLPRERTVLHLAYKASKTPYKISSADLEIVRDHWGELRAIDWAFHVAWCNYMTRVADALQIPLESENVFQP